MLAKLIAVEGPDKVGKRTQTTALVSAFRAAGVDAKRVEVPFNDGVTHRLIYWMLRTGRARRQPTAFQFVHFLNKLLFQCTYLLWLRFKHDLIVLDRWSLSATVYGDAAGVNRTFSRAMHGVLVRPAVTVVLDGSAFPRDGQADDSHEVDLEFQARVADLYRRWAIAHPDDHRVVDNRGTRQEVTATILVAMAPAAASAADVPGALA